MGDVKHQRVGTILCTHTYRNGIIVMNPISYQLTPAQMDVQVASRQNSDLTNGDILLDEGQLLGGVNGVEPDEQLMDSPSDWTSISDQYLPHQDMIDIEVCT